MAMTPALGLRLRVLLIAAGCSLALGLTAQRSPVRDSAPAASIAGTAAISGKVVTNETPARPVRRATVRLGGADSRVGQVAITDDAGVFAFSGLAAGRYLVTATRTGFVSTAFGAKRPEGAGSAISLTDGQRVTNLTLSMLRGAAITGMVRDERGEPVGGQGIGVMRYRLNPNGQQTLTRAGLGPTQTDDRGAYRVYGLPPGDYVVLATPASFLRTNDAHQTTDAEVQWALRAARETGRGAGDTRLPPSSGPNVVYAPIFYPGTPVEAAAGHIALSAGEERAGVDIALAYVPAATVNGRVTTTDGQVPPNMQATLLAHARIEGLPFSGFSSSPTRPDGTFQFSGVTPGTYTIAVRVSGGGASAGARPGDAGLVSPQASLYGLTDVSMDGSDQSVAVVLRPGVTVSGRVTFDGTTPPPRDLTRLSIGLTPLVDSSGVALAVPGARVDPAGAFSFTGVAPGRYQLQASVPGVPSAATWHLRSAMADGREVLDSAVDVSTDDVSGVTVTFSDHPAELSGTIQDAAGQPTPEYFIIVFSRDQTFWTPRSRHIQEKRPSSDGRFAFQNLPPGEYLLAAVTDVEQGEWFLPSFLNDISRAAIPLRIGDGEKKVQDIRVGR